MFAKIATLACILAVANAGLIGAPVAYDAPAIAATSENVYRSAGNLHSVSSYSKSVATPFSSTNKHDIRITNPSVYAHVAPVATYAAAPVATYAKVAPVATYAHAAPLAYHAPAVAHHAPALAYSPAVAVSHMTYSSPIGVNYAW